MNATVTIKIKSKTFPNMLAFLNRVYDFFTFNDVEVAITWEEEDEDAIKTGDNH